MLDKTILHEVYVQCKKEFPSDPASSKFQFEYIRKEVYTLSDTELLRRIKGGDKDAFTAVYYKYYDHLLRMIKRWLWRYNHLIDNDYAKELLQQAFITFWIKRGQNCQPQSIPRYIFGIARNDFRYYLRKRERELMKWDNFCELLFLYSVNKEIELSLDQEYRAFVRAIETLRPMEKKVVLLIHTGHRNYQIAGELDTPLNNIASAKYRAIKTIKQYLLKNDQKGSPYTYHVCPT